MTKIIISKKCMKYNVKNLNHLIKISCTKYIYNNILENYFNKSKEN